MNTKRWVSILGCLGCLLIAAFPGRSFAAPTEICIQGRIQNAAGAPLKGTRVYRVRFFNAESGGTQVGTDYTSSVPVAETGRFTIQFSPAAEVLSLDGVFYELAIDSADPPDGKIDTGDVFPNRVKVGAVLFSRRSADAEMLGGKTVDKFASAVHAHSAADITSGTLATARFSAHADLASEGKIGDGSGQVASGNHTHSLQNLAGAVTNAQVPDDITITYASSSGNADTVDGQHAAAFALATHSHNTFWKLGGNSGTTPGTDFLGTTDAKPLDLYVSGVRALHLEPHATSPTPNLIGGYSGNDATDGVKGAAIGGGGNSSQINLVSDDFGVIGGGRSNQAGNDNSDTTDASYGAVGGGASNAATGFSATVGGGYNNDANGVSSVVAGGMNNVSGGGQATIGGGMNNAVSANYGTIGGGGSSTLATANKVTDEYGTVGGGENNQAGNGGSTSDKTHATVGGGYSNTAAGIRATVGGGSMNSASGTVAVVAGGQGNSATEAYTAIGGGFGNNASGYYATVPGGISNSAGGDYSFVAGQRAKANHAGSFVWADSTSADYASVGNNAFCARATGGVVFHTNSGLTAGVQVSAGGNSWSSVSDRAAKHAFSAVSSREIVEKLAAIPIEEWSYKSEDLSVRHIGPMAQDFHKAFGLGDSDKAISTIDADGVALAAIQGLHEIVEEKDARIKELESRVAALERSLARMAGAPEILSRSQVEGGDR